MAHPEANPEGNLGDAQWREIRRNKTISYQDRRRAAREIRREALRGLIAKHGYPRGNEAVKRFCGLLGISSTSLASDLKALGEG